MKRLQPAAMSSRPGFGTKLKDLCEADKNKVARLIQEVASKTAECERLQKAMDEQRKVEEAAKEAMEKTKNDSRAECDSLMAEVSSFRTKLARSQALILLYRQKIKELDKKQREKMPTPAADLATQELQEPRKQAATQTGAAVEEVAHGVSAPQQTAEAAVWTAVDSSLRSAAGDETSKRHEIIVRIVNGTEGSGLPAQAEQRSTQHEPVLIPLDSRVREEQQHQQQEEEEEEEEEEQQYESSTSEDEGYRLVDRGRRLLQEDRKGRQRKRSARKKKAAFHDSFKELGLDQEIDNNSDDDFAEDLSPSSVSTAAITDKSFQKFVRRLRQEHQNASVGKDPGFIGRSNFFADKPMGRLEVLAAQDIPNSRLSEYDGSLAELIDDVEVLSTNCFESESNFQGAPVNRRGGFRQQVSEFQDRDEQPFQFAGDEIDNIEPAVQGQPHQIVIPDWIPDPLEQRLLDSYDGL